MNSRNLDTAERMTDESTSYLFSLALLSMFFQSNQANPRHRYRIRRQLRQSLK